MSAEVPESPSINAFTAHESFIATPREDRYAYYADEGYIVQHLKKKYSLHDYQRLVELSAKSELTWEHAGILAAIETATLEMHYPQLVYENLEFANCYRLQRSLELSGAYKRGGEVISIGSGETTHEVLGSYIKPPKRKLVKKMFGETKNLDIRIKEYLFSHYGDHPSSSSPQFRFLKGHLTAIEPNSDLTNRGEAKFPDFRIPKSKVGIQRTTIGKVLEEGKLRRSVDTLLWYRADPDIFTAESEETERAEETEQLFLKTLEVMQPQRNVLLTVGVGLDSKGMERRIQLLHDLADRLSQKGFTVNANNPLVFDKPMDEYWYVGQFGNLGCLLLS